MGGMFFSMRKGSFQQLRPEVSGSDLELPKVFRLPQGDQSITWLSDHSDSSGGWIFELEQERF